MPAAEGSREAELEIDESEDVEPLQTAPSFTLLSAKDFEDHQHFHIPYRDWYKF